MLKFVPLFSPLAETTWGFPILSALHVLGLAWFGGTVLASGEFPRLQRWGLAFVVLTGVVLFLMQPARYSHSIAFWAKMGLIAVILLLPRRALWSALSLWFLVICAARAIAYF